MEDEAIEILTEMMIKDAFEDKKCNKTTKTMLTKTELYKFCIKLLKLVKIEKESEEIC